MRYVVNTHGVKMPKHIVSGLKYLATIELRKNGYNHNQIAEILGMNRSTVSHYLNGRNISSHSIEVAETIMDLSPKDSIAMVYSLFKDKNQTRKLIKICSNNEFKSNIKDTCIGCGICADACMMGAVVLNTLRVEINSDWCCGCCICSELCPTKSIIIKEVK